MTSDPWTNPDPQPGDFDAFLDEIDPHDPTHVQVIEAGSDVRLKVVLEVDGVDASRLRRIAARRKQQPEQVISELLRAADRHAA